MPWKQNKTLCSSFAVLRTEELGAVVGKQQTTLGSTKKTTWDVLLHPTRGQVDPFSPPSGLASARCDVAEAPKLTGMISF